MFTNQARNAFTLLGYVHKPGTCSQTQDVFTELNDVYKPKRYTFTLKSMFAALNMFTRGPHVHTHEPCLHFGSKVTYSEASEQQTHWGQAFCPL